MIEIKTLRKFNSILNEKVSLSFKTLVNLWQVSSQVLWEFRCIHVFQEQTYSDPLPHGLKIVSVLPTCELFVTISSFYRSEYACAENCMSSPKEPLLIITSSSQVKHMHLED